MYKMKGVHEMDKLFFRNDNEGEEHEAPKEDRPSSLMEKIQQLGQTNVPQLITGFKNSLFNDHWSN